MRYSQYNYVIFVEGNYMIIIEWSADRQPITISYTTRTIIMCNQPNEGYYHMTKLLLSTEVTASQPP